MIYTMFKPMKIKQQEVGAIPLFELATFTMYELNNKGLVSIILGTNAVRYNDRYTIQNINYTDNSREYIANIKANQGVYKDNIIDLKGDVVYTREDGLVFKTQVATYNQKTSIANASGDYVSYRNSDKITGNSLEYNNILDTVKSKNVVAKYNIEEKTK